MWWWMIAYCWRYGLWWQPIRETAAWPLLFLRVTLQDEVTARRLFEAVADGWTTDWMSVRLAYRFAYRKIDSMEFWDNLFDFGDTEAPFSAARLQKVTRLYAGSFYECFPE